MTMPKLALSANAWRYIAASGTAAWTCVALNDQGTDEIRRSDNQSGQRNQQLNALDPRHLHSPTWISHLRESFAPSRTLMEAMLPSSSAKAVAASPDTSHPVQDGGDSEPERIQSYDFVIVGNGNAGRSALRKLRELCPTASIAIIDPLRSVAKRNKAKHYRDVVSGFDPDSRTVRFLNNNNLRLKYKYGLLVASGTRGAPPPAELFQDLALQKILELRTTELTGLSKRPVLDPSSVRQGVLQIANEGKKVGVLGSGWEALDLAAGAARVGTQKPTLVFGSPGPSWNILPNYLSSALRKKIRKKGIEIQDRAIVRYISTVDPIHATDKLELHTAKTYDLLETQRIVLDALVLAPDTKGSKGSAAIPTNHVPQRMQSTSVGRPWYKTWSQVTKRSAMEPSLVVCFDDDGRIATTAELCATSRVYAAGSVAKYPNAGTGQASVAGEGLLDGLKAGIVAATNMARDYHELKDGVDGDLSHVPRTQSFAAHSLPVWRSDLNTYVTAGRKQYIPTALSDLGVQALCVGHCDSERQWTRAFWWTNSSAQRRLARLINEEEAIDGSSKTAKMRRRNTRRRKKLGLVTPLYGIGCIFYLDHRGRIRGIMLWGLPFADPQTHEIKKHLLERLEYVLRTNGEVSALDSEENYHVMNKFLAQESQRLVKLTVKNDSQENTSASHRLDGPIQGFSRPLYRYTEPKPPKNSSLNVLKRKENGHLGIMGEDLYALDQMAMEEEEEEQQGQHNSPRDGDSLAVAPAKPPSASNDAMASSSRTSEADSETNAANGTDDDGESNIPVPTYPINVMPMNLGQQTKNTPMAKAKSLEELTRFLAIQRGWEDNDNRARPAKEDPLWLRPGDEKRNMSQRQIMIDQMRSILFNR